MRKSPEKKEKNPGHKKKKRRRGKRRSNAHQEGKEESRERRVGIVKAGGCIRDSQRRLIGTLIHSGTRRAERLRVDGQSGLKAAEFSTMMPSLSSFVERYGRAVRHAETERGTTDVWRNV